MAAVARDVHERGLKGVAVGFDAPELKMLRKTLNSALETDTVGEDVEAENLMFVSFHFHTKTLFRFTSISRSRKTSRLASERLLLGRLKRISRVGSSLYFV